MEPVVRVTVAGAGDAFGTGGRLQTCFFPGSANVRRRFDVHVHELELS